jgi:hypothetical protein
MFDRRLRVLAAGAIATAICVLGGTAHQASGSPTPLSPQSVLDWNTHAWTLVSQAQHPREVTPPATRNLFQTEGLVYISYVQAAVYDAAVAIGGRYEPYGLSLFAPAGASADAAVAQAAHDILNYYLNDPSGPYLTSTQIATLDGWLASSLAAIPDGQAKTDGISVGKAAALGIEAIRSSDGRNGPEGAYGTGPLAAGDWQITPGPFTFAQTPWAGFMHPFVLRSTDQFRVRAPSNLNSDAWAKDYNETKTYGRVDSTVRTAAQTETAYFWNANVINQFNRAFRDVATQHDMDLVDAAHLLAAGDMVVTDGALACFNQKYTDLFWRPITAIQNEGANGTPGLDGNPKTVGDPTWTALLTTPNHPEWPSAHGCVTAAFTEVLAGLLKTKNVDVTIFGAQTGASSLTTSRQFADIDEIKDQIADARVWIGFHYRSSVTAGLKLGEQVAKWDLDHAFKKAKHSD